MLDVVVVGGGPAGGETSPATGPSSAIGAAGVLMFLGAPSYSAQGIAGQFKVRQVAPLTADVSAQFADQSARPGSFTGQVQITASGPNCP